MILGLVMETTHVVTQWSEISHTVVGSDVSNLLLFFYDNVVNTMS